MSISSYNPLFKTLIGLTKSFLLFFGRNELFSLGREEYFFAQGVDYWQTRLLREITRENISLVKVKLIGKEDLEGKEKKAGPERETKGEKDKNKAGLGAEKEVKPEAEKRLELYWGPYFSHHLSFYEILYLSIFLLFFSFTFAIASLFEVAWPQFLDHPSLFFQSNYFCCWQYQQP